MFTIQMTSTMTLMLILVQMLWLLSFFAMT